METKFTFIISPSDSGYTLIATAKQDNVDIVPPLVGSYANIEESFEAQNQFYTTHNV